MRARVPAFRQRDTRTRTTKRKHTYQRTRWFHDRRARFADGHPACFRSRQSFRFFRVVRQNLRHRCAKKKREAVLDQVGERRCACITLARRDDHREQSSKKKRAPTETAAQKPRRERRNARLEKKNVGRSPHPNVPERAFPREQVDGVEHDGCCLRVVFCLISLFVVSRIFFPLFFSPFFFDQKKEKKKRSFFAQKKSASQRFSFIHSFVHRNASWRRASRAYTRSFERTPEASSGCNKARVFDVKKM